MPETMQAIIWDGRTYPTGLSYGEFGLPELGPDWVLVHNLAAGICGSDLHYLLGYARDQIPAKNLPAILGHENAGVVVNTGANVKEFQAGDRVAVEPLHGCTEFGGECPMCRTGKYNQCLSGVAHVGLPFVRMLPGGYGEYSPVHRSRLYPIPDQITFEEASLLDLLAVGVHAVNLSQPNLDEWTVVIGCGIIGLELIQCLRLRGARVIAVARHAYQAEQALRLGAAYSIIPDEGDPVKKVLQLTTNIGADKVYECVGGVGDTLNQAIAMCRMGGSITMVGEFYGLRPTNLFEMMMKEICLLSSNGYSMFDHQREFQVALDLMVDRKVDQSTLISHRFEPRDYRAAIDASLAKKANRTIKAVFIREQ